MAVLPDQDRLELFAEFCRVASDKHESLNLTRADMRAAVNAIDDFLHNNAGAINTAFPQPARSVLTVAQKAKIFAWVALRRFVKEV